MAVQKSTAVSSRFSLNRSDIGGNDDGGSDHERGMN